MTGPGRHLTLTAALGALLLGLAGCGTTRWQVQPYELEKLDGWEPGTRRTLIAADGETIPFHEASRLEIATSGGASPETTYVSIEVEDGTFAGRTTAGETVTVALAAILRATISDDVPKSQARRVALGIVAGVVILGVVVAGVWLLFFA